MQLGILLEVYFEWKIITWHCSIQRGWENGNWYELEHPKEGVFRCFGYIQNIDQEEVKTIEEWPIEKWTDGWLYCAE